MTRRRQCTIFGLLTAIATCFTSCTPNARVLKHSPALAAQDAQKFADTAFVERDFKQTYALLANRTQRAFSLEKIQAEMAKIHPSGYPATVKTTEYEPMPGHAGMNIFLIGENDTEKFYYRLVMEGTQGSGYRVTGFWRGNGPYPPSKLRQTLQN